MYTVFYINGILMFFFYFYDAVSLGALGDIKGAHEILKEVPGLLKKKNNQIEAYVSRRVGFTISIFSLEARFYF